MIPSERRLPSDHSDSYLPDKQSPLARLYSKTFDQEPRLFITPKTDHQTHTAARATYLEHFWRQNPSAYVAWKAGGLMEMGADNIARHNAVAGALAQELCELLHLGPRAAQTVTEAAMLHDASKLRENERFDYAMRTSRRGITKQLLEDVKNEEAMWLTHLGYNSTVITLSGANVPKRPDNFPLHERATQIGYQQATLEMAKGISGTMSLEEKIIWYVDAILYDELPVGVELRMSLGRGNGKEKKTPRELRNQALTNALKSHYGVDYYDLQEALGEHIESDLIRQIATYNPQFSYLGAKMPLPTFLDHRLDQKAIHFSSQVARHSQATDSSTG